MDLDIILEADLNGAQATITGNMTPVQNKCAFKGFYNGSEFIFEVVDPIHPELQYN